MRENTLGLQFDCGKVVRVIADNAGGQLEWKSDRNQAVAKKRALTIHLWPVIVMNHTYLRPRSLDLKRTVVEGCTEGYRYRASLRHGIKKFDICVSTEHNAQGAIRTDAATNTHSNKRSTIGFAGRKTDANPALRQCDQVRG